MRDEYKTIVDWVKEGSTVIDLGCGDGELLELLRKNKKIERSVGIDKSIDNYEKSRERGNATFYGFIDEEHFLSKYKVTYFRYDYAICNVTLQMVEHPEVLLKEMFRISKYQIISFPNFAKWQNRLELLFKGRMPQWMLCGYKWYDTGHIHQLSVKDFENFLKPYLEKNIIKRHFLPNYPLHNLTAHTAIYLIGEK
ncbi:MAG: methyltransferase domain-containing protein [Alphaproteobacteria bacterium]|nr:methyltransferase domain-containing protein [Alphaproteobacteria bacterium]